MLPTILRTVCTGGRTLVKSLVQSPSSVLRSSPSLLLPAYARSQHNGRMKTMRVSYIDPNCAFMEKTMQARVYSPPNQDGVGVAVIDRKGFPKGHSSGHHYDHYANSAHTLHGGAQAALHDLAACQALHSMGLSGATEKLRVSYIASMDLDKVNRIEAHAHIKYVDEDEATIRSDLYCNDVMTSKAVMSFRIWSNSEYAEKPPSEMNNVGTLDPRDYF